VIRPSGKAVFGSACALVMLAGLCGAAGAEQRPARSTDAGPVRPSFTWSAGFPPDAPARSNAIVSAAILDGADDIVVAGSAVGPFDGGEGCKFADDHLRHAFVLKLTTSGRVLWCHAVGATASAGGPGEHGISALARQRGEIVGVGRFEGPDAPRARSAGARTIVRAGPKGQLKPVAEISGDQEVIALAEGEAGDLYLGGCNRRWFPPSAPGLSPTLVQNEAFVLRASRDGRVVWQRFIREKGRDVFRHGREFDSALDCVTALVRSPAGGVIAGGIFSKPLTIGHDDLPSDEGTFITRVSAGGDVMWTRGVSSRLATTTYDIRLGLAASPGGGAVTTGSVAVEGHPGTSPAVIAVGASGTTEWLRAIGASDAHNLILGDSHGAVTVAGLTRERFLETAGSAPIDLSSSNAFVIQLGSAGKVTRGSGLRASVGSLASVLVSRRGVWVTGTQQLGGAGTGIFAQWLPNKPSQ